MRRRIRRLRVPLLLALLGLALLPLTNSRTGGGECGPESWIAHYTPDAWFSAPCLHHDLCYHDPSSTKDACDEAFSSSMHAHCSGLTSLPCSLLADAYYETAHLWGGPSFAATHARSRVH